MNKFMFGKFYNNLSDKEYEDLINKNDRFCVMMNEYINYIYSNSGSKIVQWNLYVGNILKFERIFDKYVFEFNMHDMKELLSSIASDSLPVLDSVYGFINQYIEYQIAVKKTISINILESFNRDEILKVNKKALIRKVVGLNEFWNSISEMETKVDINNILPLVFARYGLMGSDVEHIINADIKNIDRENMIYITVDKDGNNIIIPIDNRFIDFCEKVVDYYKEKEKGYILQDVSTDSSVYGRIRKAEITTGIKMKLNDLYRSRILDFLLDIRRERKLVAPDFQNIILMFYPNSSAGRYSSLVKFYENLTHDKVYMRYQYKSLEELEDENGIEFVNNLREELNFY